MKKVVFIVILCNFVFGIDFNNFNLPEISISLGNKPPQWINKTKGKNGLYFIGISKWYNLEDERLKDIAEKDSINNAYLKLSNYFVVAVKSEFNIKTTLNNNRVLKKYSKTLNTRTNNLIFDIKPSNIYREKKGDSFRVYTLLILTKEKEEAIKKEIKKDKKKFLELKKDISQALMDKELNKARILIAEAKGTRASFMDDSLKILEQELSFLERGELIGVLDIPKRVYMPDEYINISIPIKRDGYLYLFYKTNQDVELLYPNKYNRSAYVTVNKVVVFPDEDNAFYVTSYQEDIDKNVSIVALTTKRALSILYRSIKMDDDRYIFTQNVFKDILSECKNSSDCLIHTKDLEIKYNIDKKITIKIKADEDIRRDILEFLSHKGIKSVKSDTKVIFKISKKNSYSAIYDSNIITYQLKAILYKKGKEKNRLEGEFDKDEINEKVFDLYLKLLQ